MLVWKTRRTYKGQVHEQWHVLLAVSDGECRADIRGCATDAADAAGGALAIDSSTNRVGQTNLDALALLYARGGDPYALIEQCVTATWWRLPVGPKSLRRFPEALRGFGWCTWDSLGQNVSESGILAKMDEFKAKQVPVSWVLIDDGWSQTHNNKLTGFGADPTRFPQGLARTIDVLKQDYGVHYVGVWQAFQGYWGGVDPDSDAFKERRYMFETLPGGMTVPSAQPAWDMFVDGECLSEYGCERFWWRWSEELANAGVDFVKVDSQSTMSVLTRGAQSYGTLLMRHRAVDLAASAFFNNALINCMVRRSRAQATTSSRASPNRCPNTRSRTPTAHCSWAASTTATGTCSGPNTPTRACTRGSAGSAAAQCTAPTRSAKPIRRR